MKSQVLWIMSGLLVFTGCATMNEGEGEYEDGMIPPSANYSPVQAPVYPPLNQPYSPNLLNENDGRVMNIDRLNVGEANLPYPLNQPNIGQNIAQNGNANGQTNGNGNYEYDEYTSDYAQEYVPSYVAPNEVVPYEQVLPAPQDLSNGTLPNAQNYAQSGNGLIPLAPIPNPSIANVNPNMNPQANMGLNLANPQANLMNPPMDFSQINPAHPQANQPMNPQMDYQTNQAYPYANQPMNPQDMANMGVMPQNGANPHPAYTNGANPQANMGVPMLQINGMNPQINMGVMPQNGANPQVNPAYNGANPQANLAPNGANPQVNLGVAPQTNGINPQENGAYPQENPANSQTTNVICYFESCVEQPKSPTMPTIDEPQQAQAQPTQAQPEGKVPNIIPNSPILESEQVIELSAVGMGVAPENTISPSQALAMAKRAAIIDAYRQIGEKMYGIKINGKDTVKDMVMTNSVVKAQVEALIKNADIVETIYKDGLCQVTMELKLDSRTWNRILATNG